MATVAPTVDSYPMRAAAGSRAPTDAGERAFRGLVAREGDRWLRLAVRIAGEGDGPDVLQEALVKAWLAIARGDRLLESEGDLARWVVRVVVNQAYDVVRARGRRRRWSAIVRALLPVSTGAGATEARTAIAGVERLLDGLTAEQRVAWVLKEVEGYSGAEIAAIVGASEGAVEQRLVRARAQLERSLHDAT
jgi:RNA polymerase sigma-70 factor (ECF subfamily)